MYSIQEILSLVKQKKIRYQLTETSKSEMVNSDVVDLSKVYVYVVQRKSEASGYKIWDKKKTMQNQRNKYTFILNPMRMMKRQSKRLNFLKKT